MGDALERCPLPYPRRGAAPRVAPRAATEPSMRAACAAACACGAVRRAREPRQTEVRETRVDAVEGRVGSEMTSRALSSARLVWLSICVKKRS